MSAISNFVKRVLSVFHRDRYLEELREEIDFHIATRAKKYVAGGMSPSDALKTAQKEFGSALRYQEQGWYEWAFLWEDEMLQNIRYGIRLLTKNKVFTAVGVLSLALGVGANTAIFSLVDQLLLRMLPVENPEQLVQLAPDGQEIGAMWGPDRMSYPMYRDIRERAPAFSGVLAWYATPASMSHDGRTERIRSELVTGDYFQVLGVKAAVGRTFTAEDNDSPGAEPAAILTYDFWRTRFAEDPKIIGSTIHLNGLPVTVMGVSASGFRGLEIGAATQVFIPIMMTPQIAPQIGQGAPGAPRPPLELRRSRWISVFARLRPGVTIEQAQALVAPVYRQITEMEVKDVGFQRASESARQAYLRSHLNIFDGSTGRSGLRETFATPLSVLMAITGLVLLIACANVAGLLIARGTARQKELAVRLALGAGRMQVVSQLMIESLLLSVIAAATGLGLGLLMSRGLLQFINSDNLPMTITASPDGRVLVFSIVVAFLTTFIFGLVPALQATRPRLAETLKSESVSVWGSRGQARIRKILVIAEVSLSLLLLIVSSLFVRSLSNLYRVDPGFRRDHVVSFAIDPATNGYNPERTQQFYRDLVERLRSLPGVISAGQAVQRILEGAEWRNGITVEGYTPRPDELVFTHFNAISSGYFTTLGIPLLSGRDFDARDTANIGPDNALRSCIVNEAFARKYFSDGQALGRHIGMGNQPGTQTTIEIVGVVRNSSYDKLRGDIPAQMFIPFVRRLGAPATVVYLRTTADPATLFDAIRPTVRDMDDNLPLFSVRTMEEQIDRSLVTERMIATLSSAFGAVATVLALIGLYGVMAFAVARRSREIAIRVSLGARKSNVLGMMMREVAVVMFAGIAIAVPAYIGFARFIRSQLYGVQPDDPFHIAAAALFLLAVGLIAGYIPSRHALRVDAIQVLRYD